MEMLLRRAVLGHGLQNNVLACRLGVLITIYEVLHSYEHKNERWRAWGGLNLLAIGERQVLQNFLEASLYNSASALLSFLLSSRCVSPFTFFSSLCVLPLPSAHLFVWGFNLLIFIEEHGLLLKWSQPFDLFELIFPSSSDVKTKSPFYFPLSPIDCLLV